MGKHEPLTAKAIGKRIKSKGLQKLKFYCQMCQKQCRDANGFKCHLTSEAHQRQLLLFAENPNRYMDEFSSEFMKDFLHLLKRRYSTKRVLANQVYQEYIKDRSHLHMNSTRWCTLTGFVKWMGKKGICHVENNEKGWFLTYIDRDPETLLRNENKAKKEKLFRDDDERQAKLIQEQIERGKLSEKEHRLKNGLQPEQEQDTDEESKKVLIKKECEESKIAFTLSTKKVVAEESKSSLITSKLFDVVKQPKQEDEVIDVFHHEKDMTKVPSLSKSKHTESRIKKKSALDEIIEEQERWKAKQAQKSDLKAKIRVKPEAITWMTPGIIVRVICKDLGKQYYEKKARIESVESFTSFIKMLDNGDLLQVDERHLETVVPTKPGSKVKILGGLYRGSQGHIVKIDEKHEKAWVSVDNASTSEPIDFSFDHVCKFSE